MELEQIGLGVIAGLFIAGAGYFKSIATQTKQEGGFKPQKFIKTVILGAIVGGGTSFFGMTPDAFTALPFYAGLTTVIENLVKGFVR